MKRKITLIIGVVLLWQGLAMFVDKDILVPFPNDVAYRMLIMTTDIQFYQALLVSLSHVIVVVSVSIIIAFLLAYLGYQKPVVDCYVAPVVTVLQATPNISFLILVLIWFSSLQAVYIVLFLVVFPLLYHNFIEGFQAIDQDIRDVILLYHPPRIEKFFRVYIPLIRPSFISGIKSSLSLGVKVVVMAEILSGLPYGVGRELNYSRIQFDMVGVFAWTIWLAIMVIVIDNGLKYILNKNKI